MSGFFRFALFRQLLLVTLCAFLVSGVSSRVNEEWRFLEEGQGIKMYQRSVADSKYAEFKAETTVRSSVEKMLETARDVTAFSTWLFKCSSSTELEKKAENIRIAYLTFDVPWPAKDRNLVLQVRTEYDEGSKTGTIFLESVPDYYPAKKHFVRMSKVRGVFTFRTLPDGQVAMVNEFFMDPGKNLPASKINSPDFTFNTTENFRSRVQQ